MNDQQTYWNGEAGQRWVKEQAALDLLLRPFGEAALGAALVAPGESVLDVGCGCGDTTVLLAGIVGDEGRVVGLDVSAPMLVRALVRTAELPNVSLVEGDAASAPFEVRTYDLLFSRFGVMFFPDPTAAFTHLRRALRGDGRVTFVCWRPLAENPWAAVPLAAAASVVGPPEPTPVDAPGPFAFGDATRVRGILEAAGFRDVRARPFDGWMSAGAGGSFDEAATELVRLGPVARLLADRDEPTTAKARAAVAAALRPYANEDDGGVLLPASTWIVSAANGAT